jgi:hypothetical protein
MVFVFEKILNGGVYTYFIFAKNSTTSRISLFDKSVPIGGILDGIFSRLAILETGITNGSASEVFIVSSVSVSFAKIPFTSCPSLSERNGAKTWRKSGTWLY